MTGRNLKLPPACPGEHQQVVGREREVARWGTGVGIEGGVGWRHARSEWPFIIIIYYSSAVGIEYSRGVDARGAARYFKSRKGRKDLFLFFSKEGIRKAKALIFLQAQLQAWISLAFGGQTVITASRNCEGVSNMAD